jgi:DNA topoisomerase-2
MNSVLVNAADNKQRDPDMSKLDITIDAAANKISVKNNGKGIPVVMHKEENCYVPTLIFGQLLTGSNFDDDEKKTTGGRNGYGAKLANIFSTEFIVECLDSQNQLKFKQVFSDHMGEAGKPEVKKCSKADMKNGDYTMITFSPDLARFKMSSLDDDTVGLLSKRAYDIAGSMASREGKKLVVTLNGEKLPVKNFQDYLSLFKDIKAPVAYEKIGDRWEVGVSATDGTAAQVSFVNSICTSKGGSHVAAVADQLAAHLVGTLKKKNKGGTEVKPSQIKNHLCIFVNCLVENPAFDSQTKDFLTTQKKAFGSDCKLSDTFLKKVDKSDIVESILSFAKYKQDRELKQKGGTKKIKLTGIPKLDDANFAGGAKSKDCTLIITEGDSAKSLAMSGLSVVGRDYYGVFPLKGKPLNVRDATHAQVMKNLEIKYIIDILGLKHAVVYDETNIKTLRYGHLMIMADQDHDGSHIKGLVINIIHNFWPSLLDIPGFLQQFITPIVKITKGKKSQTFFTLPEYENWREATGNDGKGWKIKYYKGLGTSTSAEAKEYFSNLDKHEIHFGRISQDKALPLIQQAHEEDNMEFDTNVFPDEAVSGSDLIDMVFRKTRVEDRKNWLNALQHNTYLDYSLAQEKGVTYSDFINREFILFSNSDNARSIPHVMDGFKPSQRKVLYACFKRKLKDEIKVAQLAGYIGEHSAYHHGEASLHGAIINMAQSFCGSNNVNLLSPCGQFGTRRMGGKDAASPRYIFTKLEKITRAIFHPDDDALLNYLFDDGMSIEPEFYMPVIPMILVNGSDGIGTGWSSSVNNYDPRLIIANIRHMINGEAFEPMAPSYSGFTGEVSSFRFIIRLFAARYMLILIYFLSVKRLILKKTESFL